jgi:hypothetical protein
MEIVPRASPGELKAVLADVLGLPVTAVEYPYRALREHGVVSRGGRGRSAVKVKPEDAVFLLLAVCGQLPAQHVIASTQEYALAQINGEVSAAEGGFVAWDHTRLSWERSIEVAPSLANLRKHHTLAECIVALIGDAAMGRLRAEPGFFSTHGSDKCKIRIVLAGPWAHARIRIWYNDRAEEKYYQIGRAEERRASYLNLPPGRSGDFQQERRLSQDTILALATLFGAGGSATSQVEPWNLEGEA